MRCIKRLPLLSILPAALALTGCFSSDGWSEYYTPELFLEHARVHHYVTVASSSKESSIMDYELKIKDAVLGAAPFTMTNKISPKSERYFTYHILRSPSTAGPNYAEMRVWGDGHVQVDYKAALGRLESFFYTFDADKAAALTDYVDTRIDEVVVALEEDAGKARKSASIENFLLEAEDATYCNVKLHHEKVLYEFDDDGRLLDLLEEMSFSPAGETADYYDILTYHLEPVPDVFAEWYLCLNQDFGRVSIVCSYENRFGEEDSIRFSYAIDKVAGQAFYEEAVNLATHLQ